MRRWRLEMCLDDLKTTLAMEMVRSRSPAMAHKELIVRLIGHNLIRSLTRVTRFRDQHTRRASIPRIEASFSIFEAMCPMPMALSYEDGGKARSAIAR